MRGSPVNRLEQLLPRTAQEAAIAEEYGSISARAKDWEHQLEQFISDHPRLTLTAAATVGLLIGWMVKRR